MGALDFHPLLHTAAYAPPPFLGSSLSKGQRYGQFTRTRASSRSRVQDDLFSPLLNKWTSRLMQCAAGQHDWPDVDHILCVGEDGNSYS